MLHPSTSAVVMIDAPGSTQVVAPSLSALSTLVEAAQLLNIPVIVAGYLTTAAPGVLALVRSTHNLGTLISFDPAAGPWPAAPIAQAIAATGRNQLIVSGFWLEEAVTMLVLKSLAVGLDAYVAIDAIAAINSDHSLAAHARLTQAGAVPTTSDQIAREWAALTDDDQVRSALLALVNRLPRNSP
jgi:hypothetical protein